MTTTLSTRQWQRLQQLFDEAQTCDDVDALVAAERSGDVRVAEALAALLAADRRWSAHTDAAVASLSAAAAPSAVGSRLGAFVLRREIGRGGMGVVYLGERDDGHVQQQAAIKVLHAGSLDAHTRARFQRERDLLAAFDHPGIARLWDAGETDAGEPYYVMEYLRGLPIDVHCDRERLGLAQRLALLRKVCDAVQYAHSQLILHRDIKPGNVIVDAQGTPRLIDFGIAKAFDASDAARVQQTVDQHRYFSLVNATPEQLRGDPVSVTCDVYQLGTLLHELVCGSPIFALGGASLSEAEHRILGVVPDAPSRVAAAASNDVARARRQPSPRALAAALHGDLDAIVQRAVRKEPNRRYASVEQLAQDIDRHLHDVPILGRSDDRRYRFGRFLRRHRRSVALLGAAVLGIAAFTGMLLHQVGQTAAERDRAVTAGRRAEAVTAFLLDVFRSGDPAVAKKATTPIGEALSRAQTLLERQLADEPAIRARVGGALAGIYNSLGEFGTAARLSDDALALLEAAPDADAEALLAELRQNVEILLNHSQYDAVPARVDRLLSLEARLWPGRKPSWRSRLIAVTARWKIDMQDACRQSAELVDETFAAAQSDPEAFVRTLLYDARSCRTGGKEGAVRTLERIAYAQELVQRRMGGDEVVLLDLRFAHANNLRRVRRFDEAVVQLEQIARDSVRIYGPGSVSEANALLIAGGAYNTSYQFPDALRVLHRAHAIYAKVHGDAPNGDIAVVAYQLGTAYDYGKIDADQALSWYAKAYEVGKIAFGAESGNVGAFAADYGTLLRRRGDHAAAEPVLRVASRQTRLDNPIANGFMSRLNLAIVLAQREQWDEARALAAECETADAKLREDPAFKADWDALRTALARQGRS
jgi:serine/threonine-protein kinase